MLSTRSKPAVLLVAGLVALAVLHAVLAVAAMHRKSSTADEIGHVTGGYTFDVLHDYRMHPENGLLPQRWQALPAALAGQKFPTLDDPDWRYSDVWLFGHTFFYESGNDPAWLLGRARAMNSVFGAALVLLVAGWAGRLYGATGAVVSALFAALCPTMLAHSGLATSDMAMAFFLVAAGSAYWWHLHDGRKRAWLLSAAVFGLACVAKFTAVLLLPLLGLLALVRIGRPEPLVLAGRSFGPAPARTGAVLLSALGHGAAAVFVIWAFSGFRYSAFNPALPPGEFAFPWAEMLSFGGWKAEVIARFRDWHLLPEGWLYGLAFVLKHAEARGAFLDGQHSIFGWVDFFPRAFLYKTPPSLLVALAAAAGIVAVAARRLGWPALRRRLYHTLPLIVLFAVYWAFSLTSKLNIGHRHILPTYPVLYVAVGVLGWAVAQVAARPPAVRWALVGLAVGLTGWHGLTTAGIHPHYLAYFSPVVGGPAEGHRHLVDSSLDWGQDLTGLADWLAANRRAGETVHLAYFGAGDPAHEGIAARKMPSLPIISPSPWYDPAAGLYCVSATMLQQVYSPVRGDWTPAREREYQTLRGYESSIRDYLTKPEARAELLQSTDPKQWDATWRRYDMLRFARLCYYLRARRPDAMIGYSILVYRLAPAEVAAALHGDLRELAAAVAAVQ